MARLKKSLAMLLVFAMIFSTMSVAASAWKQDSYSDNDVRFTVHFFRKDADGKWVDAKGRVAPGDEVQARIYLETTFDSVSYDTALFFDGTYFKHNIGSGDPATKQYTTTNTENSSYAALGIYGPSAWRSDKTRATWNLGNQMINYMLDTGYTDTDYIKYDEATGTYLKPLQVDKDYFKYTDFVTTGLKHAEAGALFGEYDHNDDGSIADSSKDKWYYAIELTVKNNERATVVDPTGKGGYAKVPPIYQKSSGYPNSFNEYANRYLPVKPFVDIGRGTKLTNAQSMGAWEYDPEFNTQAGYVSTTSFITFDPNGGYFEDGETASKTVPGIIKTSASIGKVEKKNAEFAGWELVSGSDNTLTFDYEDKVLKAKWIEKEPEVTTTKYITKYWKMDVNGEYNLVDFNEDDTVAGETINAKYDAPEEGFYIDNEKSVLSKTADEDSLNNVLEVYYARNKYTVTYVYVDNGGVNKQVEYHIFHGKNTPAFADTVDGKVPEAMGKEFIGWSASQSGSVLNKLPETVESDLTFYAQYKNEVYTYKFYAYTEEDKANGKFSDGTTVKTLQFEYGTIPEKIKYDVENLIGKPSKDGFEFIGWDYIELNPKADQDIYATYNQLDYKVTFYDKNGVEIPNTKDDDLVFFYGETVTEAHIPDGYKSKYAWTLKDSSTAVSFPYEVTADVDFYATDSANVYDAVFKINGELYKKVPTVYLEKIEVPAYEIPAGYEFSGWDYDIGQYGDVMDNVNGKEYNATLTPKTINVTFVIEGQEDTVITGKFGETIEGIPAIPAKEGYEPGTWEPMAPATFPAEDTTYTAKWTPTTNTLTFVDYIDGVESTLGTKTGKTGATIEAQPDPEKPGYTFVCWVGEDGTEIKTAPTVMPAKSQKYVAKWTANRYDFSFDANGGKFAEDAVTSGDTTYGSEVNVPYPEMEGYEFLGWAPADVENPTASDVVLDASTGAITIKDNVALKAVWKKNVNTVTYDAGEGLITKEDGSRASKVDFEVAYGDSVPTVAEPVREGYAFNCWTEKNSGIAVPEKMPNSSLYFVANWDKNPDPITDVAYKIYAVTQIPGSDEYSAPVLVKEGAALPGTVIEVVEGEAGDNQYNFSALVPQKSQVLDTTKPTSMTLTKEGPNELVIYSNLAEYTATFDAGEGSWDGETEKTDSGKFGYEISKPEDPEREGYIFTGWEGYTDGDTFAEDKTYTANWEIQKHNAIFEVYNEDGEAVVSETVEYEYGQTITLPTIVLPEGYEYADGWDIPSDATMGEEDVTFTATIKPIDYTIKYIITNSEVAAAPSEQTFNVGDDVTVKAATEVEGYTFKGWKAADGANYEPGYTFNNIKAGSFTLEGYYEPKKFSISYNTGSLEFIPMEWQVVGNPVTELPEIPDDPDDDKMPLGWYIGNEKVEVPFDMPAEDLVLTAKYSYKVSYEYTGTVPVDAPAVPATRFVEPGEDVDIEAVPVLDGYTFNGWLIDGEPATAFTMLSKGVKITGNWISNAADEYTITYKYTSDTPVGAPAVPAPETVKEGSTVTPVVPEFEGYTFNGWYLDGEPVTSFVPTADSVLTGYWTKNDPTAFNVTYVYTGEVPEGAPALPETELVEVGIEVIIKDAPELEGYTFNGWFDASGNTAENFTMPANNVTISGYWTKNAPSEYELSFKYMGEVPEEAPALPAATMVAVGEKVDLSDVPSIDGYTFEGWFYEGDIATEITMPANNVVITGKWIKNAPSEYERSFKYMGEVPEDAPALPAAKPVKVGEKVDLSDVPSIEGYSFEGWYYEGDIVTEITMPANNVVITGKWVKNAQDTFNVTYIYTGEVPEGAPAVPAASTAKVGETVTVADVPALEGYIFSGWYVDGEVSTSFEMPASDVVITGNWKEAPVVIEKYTLTLDPNGGTLKGSSEVFVEEYEEGTDIPPVVDPVRPGFRFIRWVDAEGNTQPIPKTMPGNDVELTAEWIELYNVTYTNEDGTVYEEIVNAGAAGENIPAPTKGDPSKDGYNFIKWVDATTGEDVTVIPVGGVTLKPVFEEIVPDTYKVSYAYTNETVPTGAPALPETVFVEAGKTVDVADVPELEGYTFGGWYYEGKLVESFVMPATDVDIEGTWEVNEYTITLDANSGLFGNGSSQFIDDVEFGAELADIIPAAPEKTGYTFKGWVDEEGNEVIIPATMPAKDITAKAKWEINEYKITFNSLGGSEVAPVTLEYGAAIKDLPVPEKEGFIFTGWTDKDGNQLPDTMPAFDIEAFAMWDAKPETPAYELTIDAGEGKFSDGEDKHVFDKVAEGESLTDYLEEKPYRDGYEFIGWFDEDGKMIDEETATMPGDATTITAKWDKIKYTVTYYLASGEAVKIYDTKDFAPGEEIVHPSDPYLEGFTFVGWFDKGGKELPAEMGTEDLEAYAKFDINTYKVTYLVNGSAYAEYEVMYQAEVPVPADPESADPALVFAGWRPTVAAVMPAHDLVYTADFASIEEDKYIAKFIVDGKTHDLQVLAEGEEIVMPKNPEKFGFKFVGWKPNVPAYMPAEDMEFVAQWEVDKTFLVITIGGTAVAGGIIAGSIVGGNAAWITGVSIAGGILVVVGAVVLAKHTHTVTYLVDGEVYKTYLVVEGTKIPVPADPAKDGFTFDGWNPEVPDKMGNTDLVFEATWAESDGADSNEDADLNDGTDDTETDVAIPDTGSVAGGLAAFAVISGAAAAAYVYVRKKRED